MGEFKSRIMSGDSNQLQVSRIAGGKKSNLIIFLQKNYISDTIFFKMNVSFSRFVNGDAYFNCFMFES